MSANWNGRVEIEKTVLVANEPSTLYLNSGRRDDYVELVLPTGWRFDPATHARLSSLTRESADWSIQASLIPGPPSLVAITRLSLSPDASNCVSAVDRYTGILCELAAALPEVDFGELAPQCATRLVSPDDRMPSLSQPGTDSSEKGDNRELAVTIDEPGAASLSREESTALVGGAPAAGANLPAADGDTTRVGCLIDRAQTHASRGQLHKACRLLDDVLRESPGHLGATVLRDRIGVLIKREKRRTREPQSAQANLECGVSLLQIGCHSGAVDALRRSVSLKPTSYMAHLLLGVAHHFEGQTELARLEYESADRIRAGDASVAELLRLLAYNEAPPLPMEEEAPFDRPIFDSRGPRIPDFPAPSAFGEGRRLLSYHHFSGLDNGAGRVSHLETQVLH